MDGKNNMIIGIILAAGKGTRLKSADRNKVTLPFLNKPLIVYSVELMEKVCDKTIVVVGAFAKSVYEVLADKNIVYAQQKKQLGTAHATKMALEEIEKQNLSPKLVLVGYGDHTMFYRKETIRNLVASHQKTKAAISLATFDCQDPDSLKYGRIIRNHLGEIIDIIEQKDASPGQKLIKEVNPGFYCFDYRFIRQNIDNIQKSPVSGEFYITDLIKIAATKNLKINGLKVEFNEVGLGVNTAEELAESEKIYLKKIGAGNRTSLEPIKLYHG